MAEQLHSGMTYVEIQEYCEQLIKIRRMEIENYDNDCIYALAVLIANLAARIKDNA